MKDLLAASDRARRVHDDDADDVADVPRLLPGKLSAQDVRERPEAAAAAPLPGKLTHADLGRRGMTAADGLALSTSLLPIDRRAEPGDHDVDDGALATAFSFLEESRGGQALPEALARRLGEELGVDTSRIRIHTDERAARAAASISARAFTIGDDIYFAAGAYDPRSEAGIQLIAHEVAHVAQNQRGTARPDRRVSRPDDAHEAEADDLARRFAARQTGRFETSDPAELVEHVRREGRRHQLPFMPELEQHFGMPLDFVEAYTGPAAELACGLMSAGAFAVRNIVALADPSPQRDQLMHELTHIVQMGGRSAIAPPRFARGSLSIGAAGSAVEDEAATHAAAPVHAADPDTIHRDSTGQKTLDKSPDAAKKRVEDWKKTSPAAARIEDHSTKQHEVEWGYQNGSRVEIRYYKASNWFNASTYVGGEKDKRDPLDLDKAYKSGDATLRLSKVDKPASGYIFTEDGEYKADVNRVKVRPRWTEYKKAVDTLIGKGKKIDFKWPKSATIQYTHNEPALTKPEEDDYRDAMRTAIATAYKDGDGKFEELYKDIVASNLFAGNNRITGDIFEEVCVLSADPDWSASGDQPIFDKKTFPKEVPKGKKKVMGDGTMELTLPGGSTRILMECKAYQGDPTPDVKKQMGVYKKLLGKTGYKIKGVVQQVQIDEVCYFVTPPTDPVEREKCLDKWLDALQKNIGDGNFSLVPKPASYSGTFTIEFNPSFEFPIEKDATRVNLRTPPANHPGLKIESITANLDDNKNVTSGEIVFDVEAGDIKKQKEKRKIEPSKKGTGGRVDNKLKGLSSKLDSILKDVDIDAAIVDGGVEATIKIKKGPAKGLAGFQIEGVTLKAKYSGEGQLSVEGSVDLKHQNGKISGSVTVGYDGGWTFDGKVTVSDGFIPGVSSFTAGVRKAGPGEWQISVDEITIEKQFNAVKITGTGSNLVYDVKKGHFSGEASITADLGMFGIARGDAKIENNKLKRAVLSYDSPELKYPAKKDPATFTGTIGGDVVFDDGKFSGNIRGTANLNVPALSKIAGDAGIGLAVNASVDAEGRYSGSIKTTTPLKFGKHFVVDSIGCDIEKDGSVKGDFKIKVVDFKYLENAAIECSIDKDGFHVKKADIAVGFGKENVDKFWGTLTVKYEEGKGLAIKGELSAKIKEGMIAKGTLEYNTEKNEVSVELGMEKINVLDFTKKQSLFKFSKQFPLVSFYNIIGIYLDIGFDLDFDFNMKLDLSPKLKLEGLSMDTWEYKKIGAELEMTGAIAAALTATPKVGLGLFAISPSLLRGGGGIKIPITAEAKITPKGKLEVGYTPSGGVEGDASIGMVMTFGIKGAVKPYAEAVILDGMWEKGWTGDALTEFEILPPKELLNFTIDLAGDTSKKKDPELPTAPKEPGANSAARQLPQDEAKPGEAGGGSADKNAQPASTEPAGEKPGDDVFKMGSLLSALEGLPGYKTITGIMSKAAEVWEKIKGFFGRVVKAFKSFFEAIADAVTEVIDGFANEGIGYLPKLIKKLVGPTVWDIIEPIVNAVAGTAEQILELFETEPPTGVADFFPWALKLAKKAFGIAFDGISNLVRAIRTVMSRLADAAVKLITKMVNDGMIGVRRHCYYIWNPNPWGDDWYFLAATEYKIHVLGFDLDFKEDGMITNPNSVVAIALFEVLEALDVPPTNTAYDEDAEDTYRDRWA